MYTDNDATPAAKQITTLLTWDDLVLADAAMQQVTHINSWIKHNHTILDEWDLRRNIKPGFRSLFYGQPGTGKTLTATLIGSAAGADVYSVNLSMLISKYIGETEKNLNRVFDRAQRSNWILFFDEADALFGKRTEVTSSHDRYANQEVSYLLQRIEDYSGVVILAADVKDKIDDAFIRRLQSVIHFPMPGADERLRLWKGSLGNHTNLSDDVDLIQLAAEYELSGGSIVNVVRYAAINALGSGRTSINASDLLQGIRREIGRR